jgi:hypothetical protein
MTALGLQSDRLEHKLAAYTGVPILAGKDLQAPELRQLQCASA